MKRRFPLILTIFILIVFVVAVPVSAGIADGTYELQYEMKEAGSENTSIADGYFTKPAILTVEDGVQYIQMTVTGSNYIESLSAPTGSVDIISEDTENFVRTIKFRVDQDLSEPLDMEMHIIVPDLYDMTHTARAVFEVSGLNSAGTSNDSQETVDGQAPDSTQTGVETEENTETAIETQEEESANQEEPVEESMEKDESTEAKTTDTSEPEESEEAELETEETSVDDENADDNAENDSTTMEDEQEEKTSTNVLWITIGVFIVILIIGLVLLKLRNKNK